MQPELDKLKESLKQHLTPYQKTEVEFKIFLLEVERKKQSLGSEVKEASDFLEVKRKEIQIEEKTLATIRTTTIEEVKRLDAFKAEYSALFDEHKKLQQSYKALLETVAIEKDKHKEWLDAIAVQESQAEIDFAKNKEKYLSKIELLQKEVANLERSREQTEKKINSLRTQVVEITTEIAKLEQEKSTLSKEVEAIRIKHEEVKSYLTVLEIQKTTLLSEISNNKTIIGNQLNEMEEHKLVNDNLKSENNELIKAKIAFSTRESELLLKEEKIKQAYAQAGLEY